MPEPPQSYPNCMDAAQHAAESSIVSEPSQVATPGMPSVLMAGGTPGGAGGGVDGGGDDGGTRGGDGGNGGAGGTGGDGVPQAHPQQSQPYVASSVLHE